MTSSNQTIVIKAGTVRWFMLVSQLKRLRGGIIQVQKMEDSLDNIAQPHLKYGEEKKKARSWGGEERGDKERKACHEDTRIST